MTKDEIGDMIAALPEGLEPDELIFRLVNWAVDREREACAMVCENIAEEFAYEPHDPDPMYCAEAIRKRGEK
jgi:hypothetical protein